MDPPRLPLFWRVFAVNAALLALVAVLFLVTPVTVSAPIRLVEALILGVGLAVALVANVVLLRRAFAPLEKLARRMDTVDLLRPGQRLPSTFPANAPVGRVVSAFNRMLDRLEAERRESGRRAFAAQEAERLRIARGLHDEVGQVLTGVLLELDAVADSVNPERRHEIVETKRMVRQALEEVRRIAQELRPEMLEHLGLVSALTELATTFARLSTVSVERSFSTELPPLGDDAELAVYRIAQESLTNVARHAQASRVTVSLEPGVESVVLRVADDGRGFGGGAPPEGHGGLRGMRERALLVGGALAIKPGREGGVEVRLEVPAEPVEASVGASG
jgi:two-component system sensor histidine kinase UhpB